ncbi:MAG: phosphotransferase [Lachnospiraceae bacterium]|nr:phosphotransferase [Lachnospiraceae bacterium]
MKDMSYVKRICLYFTDSLVLAVKPVEEGHINDTFIVKTEEGRFIIQHIQKNIDVSKQEHNFLLYSEVFEKSDFLYPKWLKNKEGKFIYSDENEGKWRMYPYIEADILKVPLTDENLFECGRGLFKLHEMLKVIKGETEASYPHLHDLKYYLGEYNDISDGNKVLSGKRNVSTEEIIELKKDKMLSTDSGPLAIIHGDTKLSNILFKDGRAAGFIDMDTLMKGYPLEDLSDCIRSCAVLNGKFDREAAEKILNGYLNESDENEAEYIRKTIPDVFDKICFELGLRYYTDYLSGERYFNEKYPGYCLDRARELMSVSWYGKE